MEEARKEAEEVPHWILKNTPPTRKSAAEIKFRGGSFPETPPARADAVAKDAERTPVSRLLLPPDKTSPHYYWCPGQHEDYLGRPPD
jgi:hypothetical protein